MENLKEAAQEAIAEAIILTAIEAAAEKTGTTVEFVAENLNNPKLPNVRKMVEAFVRKGAEVAKDHYAGKLATA